MSGGRLAWIEWVRGIAAPLVLINHYLAAVWPPFDLWSRGVIDLGRVGVVAFFLVSGYVVPLSYRRQSTKVFVVRRLTRLYPVYWIVLAFAVILTPTTTSSKSGWWAEVVLNLTMAQALFGASIVAVAWTLTVELIFYIQQIATKTLRWLDHSWVLAYFWAVVFVAAIIMEHVLDRELPITFPLLLAIAGMGHTLSMRHAGSLSKSTTIWCISIVGTMLIAASLGRADVDAIWPSHLYALSICGGFALFALAYILRERFQLRWAIWLGGISYSLYLTHAVCGTIINRAPTGAAWIALVIAIFASFASAWVLHRWVEKPMIRFGRAYTGHASTRM